MLPQRFLAALAVAAVVGANLAAGTGASAQPAPVQPVDAAAKAAEHKVPEHKRSVRFDTSRCAVPDSLVSQDVALPHVGLKLRNDQPIKIVAVGSSSTAGHGASSPSHAYPARLAVELLEQWPRAQLTVVNRGVGGDRTAQMMARFDRDVLREKPDLVIWQVGTNDSLAGDAIPAMRKLILDGIDELEAAGSDVILMSPQYAPRFNESADHLLRVEAVRQAARERHVGLFRRYEIMQSWIQRDKMTFATMVSKDGLHMNDLSYACMAHLLARQVADASRAIPLVAIRPATPMPTANAMPASVMSSAPMASQQAPVAPVGTRPVEAPAVAARSVEPSAGAAPAPISPNTRW
ncbi:MAG TPA: GDSL-type esterase/lipase family protein [Alphaproteobacteria bacterium]|jgi:lysophospholipase L1-like esterase